MYFVYLVLYRLVALRDPCELRQVSCFRDASLSWVIWTLSRAEKSLRRSKCIVFIADDLHTRSTHPRFRKKLQCTFYLLDKAMATGFAFSPPPPIRAFMFIAWRAEHHFHCLSISLNLLT